MLHSRAYKRNNANRHKNNQTPSITHESRYQQTKCQQMTIDNAYEGMSLDLSVILALLFPAADMLTVMLILILDLVLVLRGTVLALLLLSSDISGSRSGSRRGTGGRHNHGSMAQRDTTGRGHVGSRLVRN